MTWIETLNFVRKLQHNYNGKYQTEKTSRAQNTANTSTATVTPGPNNQIELYIFIARTTRYHIVF